MVTCTVCGGEDFEKHAGFIYCAVCQTQSQDYHEEEYDYRDHEMNVIRRQKSQSNVTKPKKQKFYDDGLWTTWEGFNFILYGMTQEIKKFGVPKEFEEMVLKIWAAYLRKCQIAFISKNQEVTPKLGFSFKRRDAQILYNMDVPPNLLKERTHRSKSYALNISNNTVSTVSSRSKKSLAFQKGKIIAADYQDKLFSSLQNNSNLADQTLETLGKSFELETSEESIEESGNFLKCFKSVFKKEDYKLYKNSYQSKRLMMNAKNKAKRDVQFLAKNKLLSIIHLALLMTGSTVQLSDLLRFIRESYLSYAKVTHFFPNDMRFPKKDFSYVEVISDYLMPTHLHQRKISSQLASLLKIERIPTPNMSMLVDRYCQDLNLPRQLAELSKKLLREFVPSSTVPRSKTLLPSYEAWAMASVLLVMKLLLGLNDKTEIFLSRLAREVNSARGSELFVFEDWQKFIECRKTVLTNFHYPTQEQLGGNSESSKKFLETLMKESKDEYRNDRFIPYSKYYMENNLLEGIKNMLNSLSEPQGVGSLEFQPSLTPQLSHMKAIMQNIFVGVSNDEGEICGTEKIEALPKKILKQSFENCDLLFALDPDRYLNLIEKESNLFIDFNINHGYSANVLSQKCTANNDFLFKCSTKYWIFGYPNTKSGHLVNFKEDVFEKTPHNFRWLITECARMLEMNVRDIYDELLRLEKKLSPESLCNRKEKKFQTDLSQE